MIENDSREPEETTDTNNRNPQHTGLERKVKDVLHDTGVRSVLACVSGGADSVALLNALVDGGFVIRAVHCNFHLRGAESDRDQAFVEALCQRLGVGLEVIDIDVASYTRDHNASVEMACRELRYAEFRKLHHKNHTDRIAVAHNADDNAETVLLNLMRGSGVAGLRGMKSDTGEIIRPLLGISRQEILRYLDLKGEAYVTDSTNLESDYRRNFLRNEVIPLFESRWPEAKKSICRSAEIMRQEEVMLKWAESQFRDLSTGVLELEEIRRCPDPLWLITRFVMQHGCKASTACEILREIEREEFISGKQWNASGGRIMLERSRLEFLPDVKQLGKIQMINKRYELTPETLSEIRKAPLSELWTTLPPDKIVFRTYRTGDRIKPLGMNGRVLVSKVFKDAKLSQADKERCIVAEESGTGEIIWVEGLKRSRMYLVEETAQEAHKYCRKT